MRSNWYIEELGKAIAGYRETIAGLEGMKNHIRRGDRDELWWQQADAQIRHLRRSIASLEKFLSMDS